MVLVSHSTPTNFPCLLSPHDTGESCQTGQPNIIQSPQCTEVSLIKGQHVAAEGLFDYLSDLC